jgi:hypothetical protein
MPALSPLLRGYLPPVALAFLPLLPLALLPAFQTGVCPVPPQSQHVGVCGGIAVSLSLPMALLPTPASLHGNLAFNGPVNAALASLPALHWRPCPHVAGIIASIALLSLLALHRRCCPRRAGILALVLLASSILLHPRCRQHRELASASHNAVATGWYK